MNLYRLYTPEPVVEGYEPVAPQELDNVENFSKLMNDNLTRFLGVPKRIWPINDWDNAS
jgi:hypothetical protein